MALPFYHCTGIITKPASAKEKTVHFAKGFCCYMIYFFYIMAKDYTAGVAAAGEV